MCQGETDEASCARPVQYEDHLGAEGRAWQMAGLRKLVTAFAGVPGIIGLHGGLPPASAFPITELTYTLKDGQKIVVDDPAKVCL